MTVFRGMLFVFSNNFVKSLSSGFFCKIRSNCKKRFQTFVSLISRLGRQFSRMGFKYCIDQVIEIAKTCLKSLSIFKAIFLLVNIRSIHLPCSDIKQVGALIIL